MPNGYYKISAAQAESDTAIYQHEYLIKHLNQVQALRKGGLPTLADIRATHRLPFKKKYVPIILMASELAKYTTNTDTFNTTYVGDIQAQAYMRMKFSASNLDDSVSLEYAFSFCPNFVPALIKKITFEVSGDKVLEFSGNDLYVWSQLFVCENNRPALAMMWKETAVTFSYAPGVPGSVAAQDSYATASSSFEASFARTPLQAPRYSRDAFDLWFALDPFTIARSYEECYPLSTAHNLERTFKYELNNTMDLVNVYRYIGVGNEGFVENEGANVPWLTKPTTPTVELYINYIYVHSELQATLSLNTWSTIIRKFADISVLVNANGNGDKKLALGKTMEHIVIIPRFNRNVTETLTGSSITDGVTTDNLVYKIDPYYLPPDTKPLNQITVEADGQVFEEDLEWDQIAYVNPYIFKSDKSASPSGTIGLITFAQEIHQSTVTSSYNAAYAPRPTISWKASAFNTGATTQGNVIFVIFSINVLAMRRGMLSVRYS